MAAGSSNVEIIIIVVLMAMLLFTLAYTLNIEDGAVFGIFLVAVIGLVGGLLGGSGLAAISASSARTTGAR